MRSQSSTPSTLDSIHTRLAQIKVDMIQRYGETHAIVALSETSNLLPSMANAAPSSAVPLQTQPDSVSAYNTDDARQDNAAIHGDSQRIGVTQVSLRARIASLRVGLREAIQSGDTATVRTLNMGVRLLQAQLLEPE